MIWVDEAGLLGSRDAARLFAAAERLGSRVVLSGDRAQHGSVARGAVLRLLAAEAGLAAAEVTTVRRQHGIYRDAVRLLGEGRVAAGFDLLDGLGWVRELDDGRRLAALIGEYTAAAARGESVLVVSPTHAEGRRATAALRAALLEAGRLHGPARLFARLDARGLTAAERGHAGSYAVGDVVEFHAAGAGFRCGDRLTVLEVLRESVKAADADGRTVVLPLQSAARFETYAAGELPLAVGDRVRVTKNGRTADRARRLENGSLHTVAGFTAGGGVRFESGAEVAAGFAHLDHGYVVTSHASQGKTVDVVLVAESGASLAAAGREQFYVSVSRGRERALVFTDDKAALKRAVERADPRTTATELMAAVGPSAAAPRVRRRPLRPRAGSDGEGFKPDAGRGVAR